MENSKLGVIYTCITGGYDKLKNHAYTNPNWDYVCFSDDPGIKNTNNLSWQIKPLAFDKLDDVRNQRWHKLHPHLLFQEYEKSIWIDANVNVLKKDFFNDINKAISEKRIMSIALHPERDCLYDELFACIEIGKDNEIVMKKQVDLIQKDGFPKKQGLFETNIIFRQHNNKEIVKIMEDWWGWIANYSRRDQLSLTYILWKHHMKVQSLTDTSYRHRDCVEFIYCDEHATKEELIVQRNNLQREIQQKDQQIQNMKSSKFWKLQEKYMFLRNGALFTLLSFKKFIKKYCKNIKFLFSLVLIISNAAIYLDEVIDEITVCIA